MMKKGKKRVDMYSAEGSRKTQYYAIIKLLENGLNQFQIHKKLKINRYSVKKVAEKWLAEQREGEQSDRIG